jgi:cytochrome c nitrite reductase small subunit
MPLRTALALRWQSIPTVARWMFIFLAVLGGAFFVAVLVLQIPSVAHYTDDPKLCGVCHVMTAHVNDHRLSSHRHISCNDCHVAHGPISQVVTKATSGARHTAVFLAGTTPVAIRAHASSQALVQANCLRCHETQLRLAPMGGGLSCLHCHHNAGHSLPLRR